MSDNIINFKKPKKEAPKPNKPAQPPLINLPFVTKAILIAIIAIYAVMGFVIGENDREFLILNFGFIPAIWTGQSPYSLDIYAIVSPISYIFLHGNMMHLIMNSTMLMAFGAGVEKWMGAKKYLLFFILCGVISVLVETVIHPFSQNPVIGASGALSGLFAAVLILLQKQGRLPTGKYGILPFAALWIGISLVFGFVGGQMAGGQIAWAAHLGGFLAGFILLKLNYFKII